MPLKTVASPGKEQIQHFEVQPVFASVLTDVADFLHRRKTNGSTNTTERERTGETEASIERRVRWLLLENPLSIEGAPLGYCLRDSLGVIRGLTLCFPSAFLSGDQRLFGLGSACFFVEPPARSLGFYLFKRYLSQPGYSFFFSTTCNAASGELWKRLGANVVPNSETEYLIPLRLDRVIPAIVTKKLSSDAATGIARLLGLCANPILRLRTHTKAELTVEPCQDWDKLSGLARRHRHRNHITSDRSVEFLRWRYGPASPLYPCDTYLFRDKQGNEGWFSLSNLFRGAQVKIRGSILLDVIWPREKMNFSSIIREIVGLASAGADAIVLRAQPGLDYREYRRWVVPYKVAAPRVFVKVQKGGPPLAVDSLDYDDNDFGAFVRHWSKDENERF